VTTLYDAKSVEVAGTVEQKKAIVCPICGEILQWDYNGLTDSRQILTCKNGHRSVTATYEKVETLAK
jgi:hypothetical protein